MIIYVTIIITLSQVATMKASGLAHDVRTCLAHPKLYAKEGFENVD